MNIRLMLDLLFEGLVAGTVALAGVFLIKHHRALFVRLLGFVLLGYLLAGRGFAYLGNPPIFISEILVGFGLAAIAIRTIFTGRIRIGALTHPGMLFVLAFAAWGAFRTLPYLSEFGLNALRDGVIWGYASLAVVIAILISKASLFAIIQKYRNLILILALWLLVVGIFGNRMPIPSWPWANVELIELRPGDANVHLGGLAAFVLLRLDRLFRPRMKGIEVWGFWLLWGGAWLWYGTINRSGMIAAALAILIVIVFRPTRPGWLRPAVLTFVLIVALLVAEVSGITLRTGSRRELSATQLVTNITSLFGGQTARRDQVGTVQWRLRWWNRIADYTLFGPYLWTGKGFGINLAEDDGFFQVAGADEATNRHPHNATFNILARSGIIGVGIWLLLLVHTGWSLFIRARRRGPEGDIALWILAYWMAFLFHAHTSLVIESPMSAIWFWSLIGASWVLLYGQSVVPVRQRAQTYPPGIPPGRLASI